MFVQRSMFVKDDNTEVSMKSGPEELKILASKRFPNERNPVLYTIETMTDEQLLRFDSKSTVYVDEYMSKLHRHFHQYGLLAGLIGNSLELEFGTRNLRRVVFDSTEQIRLGFIDHVLEYNVDLSIDDFHRRLARISIVPNLTEVRHICEKLFSLFGLSENKVDTIYLAAFQLLQFLEGSMTSEQQVRLGKLTSIIEEDGRIRHFEELLTSVPQMKLEESFVEDSRRLVALAEYHDANLDSDSLVSLNCQLPIATLPLEICIDANTNESMHLAPITEEQLGLMWGASLEGSAAANISRNMFYRVNGTWAYLQKLGGEVPEYDHFFELTQVKEFQTMHFHAVRASFLAFHSPCWSVSREKRFEISLCMNALGMFDLVEDVLFFLHSSEPLIVEGKMVAAGQKIRTDAKYYGENVDGWIAEKNYCLSHAVSLKVSSWHISNAVAQFAERSTVTEWLYPCWPVPRKYGFAIIGTGGKFRGVNWVSPGNIVLQEDSAVMFYMDAPNTAKCRITVDDPGAYSDNQSVPVPLYRITGDRVSCYNHTPMCVPRSWFGVLVDDSFRFAENTMYWFTVYEGNTLYGCVPFFLGSRRSVFETFDKRSRRGRETWTDLPVLPWPEIPAKGSVLDLD